MKELQRSKLGKYNLKNNYLLPFITFVYIR